MRRVSVYRSSSVRTEADWRRAALNAAVVVMKAKPGIWTTAVVGLSTAPSIPAKPAIPSGPIKATSADAPLFIVEIREITADTGK